MSVETGLLNLKGRHGTIDTIKYRSDLASAYVERSNEPVKATLDVIHNPRWAGTKSIYTPEVMDRIYLMDHWYETKPESVRLFGTEVSPETHLAPSDHFGVVAEVMFKKWRFM